MKTLSKQSKSEFKEKKYVVVRNVLGKQSQLFFFEYMSGVSFLPFADHTYRQAPYQDCSKAEYEQLVGSMPKDVDWESKLAEYEDHDTTAGSQELACSADGCEIVDLVSV